VSITEQQYLEVVRRKTAQLFQAAGQLGAILGNASPAQEQGMAQYGLHLGNAFQLIDDVLDYSGDAAETGKNLGDDLNEGKPTLPLIHVLQRGNARQAEVVRLAIERGGRGDFDAVTEAIRATGALGYARERARAEADAAVAAIAMLPASPFRERLIDLAEFSVTRNY
jgi:octaprenyl-diphosphate synthase